MNDIDPRKVAKGIKQRSERAQKELERLLKEDPEVKARIRK